MDNHDDPFHPKDGWGAALGDLLSAWVIICAVCLGVYVYVSAADREEWGREPGLRHVYGWKTVCRECHYEIRD